MANKSEKNNQDSMFDLKEGQVKEHTRLTSRCSMTLPDIPILL